MKRLIACLLLASLLLATLLSCGSETETGTVGSEAETEEKTEASTSGDGPTETSVYSGTPDTSWFDPAAPKKTYTLTTADQFVGFFQLRSETVNFDGITVKLAVNVVFNEGNAEDWATNPPAYSWRQINSAYAFKGTFDGQNATVSGLYLQCTTSAVRGMFGGVGGAATIKNFNLTNTYFGGPSADGKSSLGAIVARTVGDDADITLSNIHVSAYIKEGSAKFASVGGLIGTAEEGKAVFINNCSFDGKIDMPNSKAIGGLIGKISSVTLDVTIKNSTNNAALIGEDQVGGIIGYCSSPSVILTLCANKGTITCQGFDKGDLFGKKISQSEDQNPEDLSPKADLQDGSSTLRVMSFNVQTNVQATNGVPSELGLQRINAVSQEIRNNDPDLLGLQEDNYIWVDYLKERLPGYSCIDTGTGSERTAIFFKSGMKLVSSGSYWLTASGTNSGAALTMKDLNETGGKFYMSDAELAMLFLTRGSADSALMNSNQKKYIDKTTGEEASGNVGAYLSTRRMTYGLFDVDGQAILYVNTHLTHRSPNNPWYNSAYAKLRSNERIAEFDMLQKHIDDIRKSYPNVKVFITGDFNDLEGEPIYVYATKSYVDSSKVAETDVSKVDATWNNAFNVNVQGDNYPSGSEGTGTNKLDYCFIDGDAFRVLRYKNGAGKAAVKTAAGTEKYVYTSDHLPIIIDLNFKTPGGSVTPVGGTAYNGIPDKSWFTGDKTEYTLTNPSQLLGFMSLRADQITFEGITIKLGADMVINDATAVQMKETPPSFSWPQLNSAYLFKGTFDGQGHTVSGIYLKCTTSAVRGMFGGVGGNAVIKDLKLDHCCFGGPTATGKSNLGILMAKVVDGANVTVSGVQITDALMFEDTALFTNMGGFVGLIDGNSTVSFTDCSIAGSITLTQGSNAGGFIGSAAAGCTVNVTNCTNRANVTAKEYAGGLGGKINASVTATKFSSTGTITATNYKADDFYKAS